MNTISVLIGIYLTLGNFMPTHFQLKEKTIYTQSVHPKDSLPKTGCISGDCSNGTGVYVYPDGSKYEGKFYTGKKHGAGIITYADGSRFAGIFYWGKKSGAGTEFASDGSIKKQGIYKNDKYKGTLAEIEKRRQDTMAAIFIILIVLVVVGLIVLAASSSNSSKSRSSSSRYYRGYNNYSYNGWYNNDYYHRNYYSNNSGSYLVLDMIDILLNINTGKKTTSNQTNTTTNTTTVNPNDPGTGSVTTQTNNTNVTNNQNNTNNTIKPSPYILPLKFAFKNQTGFQFQKMQLSEAGKNEWGDNMLHQAIDNEHTGYAGVILHEEKSDVLWDIKVINEKGEEFIWKNVQLEDNSSINMNYDPAKNATYLEQK